MWWIIIGAVIALVVMIVLLVLFTGKSGDLERGLLDCEAKGGSCLIESVCKDKEGTLARAFDCSASSVNDGVCCFGVESET
jgi:hypothetical protein